MGQGCNELGWKTDRQLQLSDRQWEALRPLLPGKAGDPGRTAVDNRNFVDAVLWVLGSGAHWNQLPEHFGPYKSVHKRYKRWKDRGVWDRVFAQLRRDIDTGLPLIPAEGALSRVIRTGENVFDVSL